MTGGRCVKFEGITKTLQETFWRKSPSHFNGKVHIPWGDKATGERLRLGVKDLPRQQHRIPHAWHRPHCPVPQGVSVHHTGIAFHSACNKHTHILLNTACNTQTFIPHTAVTLPITLTSLQPIKVKPTTSSSSSLLPGLPHTYLQLSGRSQTLHWCAVSPPRPVLRCTQHPQHSLPLAGLP